MVTGIVRQLNSGLVVECSAVEECMKNNPEIVSAYENGTLSTVTSTNSSYGCWKKNCQLSVPNHGERCMAYPKDTTKWEINTDVSQVKQII